MPHQYPTALPAALPAPRLPSPSPSPSLAMNGQGYPRPPPSLPPSLPKEGGVHARRHPQELNREAASREGLRHPVEGVGEVVALALVRRVAPVAPVLAPPLLRPAPVAPPLLRRRGRWRAVRRRPRERARRRGPAWHLPRSAQRVGAPVEAVRAQPLHHGQRRSHRPAAGALPVRGGEVLLQQAYERRHKVCLGERVSRGRAEAARALVVCPLQGLQHGRRVGPPRADEAEEGDEGAEQLLAAREQVALGVGPLEDGHLWRGGGGRGEGGAWAAESLVRGGDPQPRALPKSAAVEMARTRIESKRPWPCSQSRTCTRLRRTAFSISACAGTSHSADRSRKYCSTGTSPAAAAASATSSACESCTLAVVCTPPSRTPDNSRALLTTTATRASQPSRRGVRKQVVVVCVRVVVVVVVVVVRVGGGGGGV